MINPVDYLYYKVYKSLSYISGGGNPITQLAATGILLALNTWTIGYLILGELTDTFMSISSVLLFLFVLIYFSSREREILVKYKQESDKSRIIGNWIVISYIIFTFTSCYLALVH